MVFVISPESDQHRLNSCSNRMCYVIFVPSDDCYCFAISSMDSSNLIPMIEVYILFLLMTIITFEAISAAFFAGSFANGCFWGHDLRLWERNHGPFVSGEL